jgi:hypothetical protein
MTDTVALQDACRILDIAPRELLAMVEDGRLQAVQRDGEIRIPWAELEAARPA